MSIRIIGCGAMGSAIAQVLTENGKEISVFDKHEKRAEGLARAISAHVSHSPLEGLSSQDILLLAIKPQDFQASITDLEGFEGKLIVSIMTGISTAQLKQAFADNTVLRLMPNLAVRYGDGIVALAEDPDLLPLKEEIEETFAPLGLIRWFPEEQFDAVTALTSSGGSVLAGGSGVIFILGLAWIITKSIQSCYHGSLPHRRQPEANSLASSPGSLPHRRQPEANSLASSPGSLPHRRQPEANSLASSPTNEKIILPIKLTATWAFLNDCLGRTKRAKKLATHAWSRSTWKQSELLDKGCYGNHRKITGPMITETQAAAYKKIFKELSILKTDSLLELGCGPLYENGSWFSRCLPDFKITLSDCKLFVTNTGQTPEGFIVVDLDDPDSTKLPTKMKALVAFNVFTCETSSTLVKWLENAKSLLDKDGLVLVFTDTVPLSNSSVALLLKKKPNSLVFPCIESRIDRVSRDHLLHITKSQLVEARDQFQIDSQEYKFLDYLRCRSEELSQQEKEHLVYLMDQYTTEKIRVIQETLQALMPKEELEVNMYHEYRCLISEAFRKANYDVKIDKECVTQKEYQRPKERFTFLSRLPMHTQINSINIFPDMVSSNHGSINPVRKIEVNYKFSVIAGQVNSD